MSFSITRILRRALILATVIPASLVSAIEEPAHTVEKKEGSLEIRRYSPSIVAETVVTGPWEQASNKAFRQLADFIFGNNSTGGKVAMTAPVGMEAESKKIAMTAPVGMEKAGASGSESDNGPWRMSFTMPSEYTMDTLPKPKNSAVTIRQLPERTMAVIRFSGSGSEKRFAEKEKALREWVAKQGWKVTGTANYSQYNPPWTPGFFRRNEVILPVAKAD